MIPSTIRSIPYFVILFLLLAMGIQQAVSSGTTSHLSQLGLCYACPDTPSENSSNTQDTDICGKYDTSEQLRSFIDNEINKFGNFGLGLIFSYKVLMYGTIEHLKKEDEQSLIEWFQKIETEFKTRKRILDNCFSIHGTENLVIQKKNYDEVMEACHYLCQFTAANTYAPYIYKAFYNFKLQYDEIVIKNENINNLINYKGNNCNPCKHFSIRSVLNHGKAIRQKIESFLRDVEYINSFLGTDKFPYLFDKTELQQSLNVWDDWIEKLENIKVLEVKYQNYVKEDTFISFVLVYIQPFIQCVIFVFGFVGNALLLTIFVKHQEMRTTPNLMLINLACVDCLNLIAYVCQIYIYAAPDINDVICLIFRFSIQLCIGVSSYSVVVISYQRFLAVSEFSRQPVPQCRIIKNYKYFPVLLVWFTSTLIAIIELVYVLVDENCHEISRENNLHYAKDFSIINFVVICIVPLSVNAILSIVTAKRLKRSALNLPGRRPDLEHIIKARIISSKVLLSLTVVFAVSYVPHFLLLFLQASINIHIDRMTGYVVILVTYSLIFCNSCFNPIALYLFSTKFKLYFKMYMLCGKKNNTNEKQNNIPLRNVEEQGKLEM